MEKLSVSDIIIRRAIPGDASKFYDIHHDSIQELTHQDDSITAERSSSSFSTEMMDATLAGNSIFLIDRDNDLLGFGHVKMLNKEKCLGIMGIYLTPTVTTPGIGNDILIKLIEEAKKIGIIKLTVCSTIEAKDFYLQRGFMMMKDELDVKIAGTKVKMIPMEIIL